MEEQQCLNFCEILQVVAGEGKIKSNIDKAKLMGGLTRCERIYFGSYFCGQYFRQRQKGQIEELIGYCKAEHMKLTLVIPILTEKHLKEGKKKIQALSRYFGMCIDEVTVNDFGMLDYMAKQYDSQENGDIKLNLWRILMKDYRDPRYTEYFNTPLKPRTFTNYLRELIRKYAICGVEFDPTHAVIDWSECPKEVLIGMHTPYCYETVGQICQMAGIHKPIEKKFRPNDTCQMECGKHQIHYSIEEGHTWIKHGRTVYFKNEGCEAIGIDKIRKIYCPLEWEEVK